MTGDQQGAEEILTTLRGRRDVLMEELLKIDGVRVDRPNSTFYLFPDITEVYERSEAGTPEEFRLQTLHATGVAFCTREHFGSPLPEEQGMFLRFAFSGIPVDDIREGLCHLKAFWS